MTAAAWALRNLRRRPARTGLVVLGIAVAAALLLDMVMLRGGMERSFERMLLSRGYQIRVSPKGTLPFDTEATLPDVSSLVAELRDDPDVLAAGAVVAAAVFGSRGDSTIRLVGYGVDPLGQALYQPDHDGDLVPGDTVGLVVGRKAAGRAGWSIGDTVVLRGMADPQAVQAGVERRLVVRGIVDWLYDSRDQASVGTLIGVMQPFAGLVARDGASAVMVKVRPGRDVASVAARLAERHPEAAVNSVEALVKQFRTRLVYFRQLAAILATISFIVAVLLVGTILTISINERMGEIAVLRAIGVARARVVVAVVAEGLALAGVGSALGVGLGLGTARYLDGILTSFPGLPAAISFFVADVWSVVLAGAALLVAGTLASWYPAWLAASAPIAATLRAEGD